MEKYTVYMHTNQKNLKNYIGITKQVPQHRWGKDGKNYKTSPCFWRAIQKYGWDHFTHNILYKGLSRQNACEIEIELIRLYQAQDRRFGYNIMEGGETPVIPEEVRKHMSRSMAGNKNGLGHTCSEEKKEKIRRAQIGRRFTIEHKKKLSESKRGKPHCSPSMETRHKISESHKKKSVICLETSVVYPSIQQCARDTGILATTICAVCKGRIKSTGGLHFRYYSDHEIKA